MTPNYIQILANIYNEQRKSAICSAVFASWTIFTTDDDEFLEECMVIFRGWTVFFASSPSLDVPNNFPSVIFNEEEEECDGVCCRCTSSDEEDLDYEFGSYPMTDSSQSDGGYGTVEECIYSENEDSEEERTSGLLRRTDLAGYTPVATDSSISIGDYGGWSEIKFADMVAPHLPSKGTTLLINGLVPTQADTKMDPSTVSIDSHVCGSECKWCQWYTFPSDDECEPLLEASTSPSSTTTSSYSDEEEDVVSVCCPGPFADLVASLLPPKSTPLLINGVLVPAVMDPPSSFSSLCLHDRSLSHHSIISSSSSIDSHDCGSVCWMLATSTSSLSSSEEEAEEKAEPAIPKVVERVPLTGSVHMGHSKGLLVPSQTIDSDKMMVFRLMAECDVMMEKIVELKKKLRMMA